MSPVISEYSSLIGFVVRDEILELIAEQLLDVVILLNRAHRKYERIRRG